MVLDVKPVDQRLKGKNMDSGKPVDQRLKGKKVDSGVVLDVKPVDQSFEVRAVVKPLTGKKVESGVVLDVKPVDQPLKGKNNLETAFCHRISKWRSAWWSFRSTQKDNQWSDLYRDSRAWFQQYSCC